MSANFQKLQALHRARLDKAKSRMAVVDKAEADLEERVAEAQAWFRQAHMDLKAAQDMLAERKLELVMKQADIEKAQDEAKEQAANDEAVSAARTRRWRSSSCSGPRSWGRGRRRRSMPKLWLMPAR